MSNAPFLLRILMSNNYGGLQSQFLIYGAGPRLANVSFPGNQAYRGGGLYQDNGGGKMENVAFSGNSASQAGGGIYLQLSDRTVVNATLSGNTAGTAGGGIRIINGSTAVLSNTILWGNDAPTGPQWYGSGYTIGYSTVEGELDNPATHVYGWDPIFVDADGPDDLVGTIDDDLRLAGTSPAIDAGSNPAVPVDVLDLDGDGDTAEILPVDLAFNPRFVDHFRPDSGEGPAPVVDMGAYETAQNRAPVLDSFGAPYLDSIDEDDLDNPGTLVADLIASVEPGVDMITDPDPGAVEGIAVFSLDTDHGNWEYSIDDGGSWGSFGMVSDSAAVLLGTGPNDRIRFLPETNWNGTIGYAIIIRAWDQADGYASGTAGVDVTTRGGATAYSANTEAIEITVQPVNDPLVAHDDSGSGFETDEDTPFVTGSVLSNDQDVDGDELTVVSLDTSGTTGDVDILGGGTFDYDTSYQFDWLAQGEVTTDTFGYTVSDGEFTDTATVSITVVGVNDPPTISGIEDQEGQPGEVFGPLPFTVGDPDTTPADLILSAETSNEALLPLANISLAGSGVARSLTLTPTAGVMGTAVVTVTVDDGLATASEVFEVRVNQHRIFLPLVLSQWPTQAAASEHLPGARRVLSAMEVIQRALILQ